MYNRKGEIVKKKNGFTLVELLAVIVILAIILIIAMPKISEVIKKTRLSSLEATTKMIINSAEKKYTENQVLEQDTNISCSDVAKLNKNDYGTCKITFDDKGNASVILNGKKDGKFDNLTCSGTKGNITCSEGQTEITLKCVTGKSSLIQGDEYVNGQYTYRYMQEIQYDDTWHDAYSRENGWGVVLTDKNSTAPVTTDLCSSIDNMPIVSMSYMQFMFSGSAATSLDISSFDTSNVENMMAMFESSQATTIIFGDKWNTSYVREMNKMFSNCNITSLDLSILDLSRTDSLEGMFTATKITNIDFSKLDTTNIRYMNNMFSYTKNLTLDLTGLDTSNVTNMDGMFYESQATTIIFGDKFDTSNVTDMSSMFSGSRATSLDLSSFNTINVTNMGSMFYESVATTIKGLESFDTSNVTDMMHMFANSKMNSLDLSSFNTTDEVNMYGMFSESAATTGYAKTCEDAARFNASDLIPDTLTFTVKDTTC